jgi:hypothetical protein
VIRSSSNAARGAEQRSTVESRQAVIGCTKNLLCPLAAVAAGAS